jgi:hypothetical protein
MQFLTHDEAKRLATTFTPTPLERFDPYSLVETYPALQVAFENVPGGRLYWVAERIADSLEYFDWCLLWVTLTEVWAGTENLHLYYTLRRSYGERSEIEQKPGQRFLRQEKPDLVSFLQVGMLNGWDMVLLTSHDYGRVFVSHDGWAECVHPNGQELLGLQEVFAGAKLEHRIVRPAS